jgi:hypothetical protein
MMGAGGVASRYSDSAPGMVEGGPVWSRHTDGSARPLGTDRSCHTEVRDAQAVGSLVIQGGKSRVQPLG